MKIIIKRSPILNYSYSDQQLNIKDNEYKGIKVKLQNIYWFQLKFLSFISLMSYYLINYYINEKSVIES